MSALARVVRFRGTARRRALFAGALALLGVGLAVTLLSVSGWLIAASGLAGLGAIAMIELFAPGAIIRGSAVGRTVARYGERLAGHDAMLRQLAGLRLNAFRRLMRWPTRRLASIASGDLLTRLTRDIDTLELLLPRWWLPNAAAVGGSLISIVVIGTVAPALLWMAVALPLVAVSGLVLVQRLGRSSGRRMIDENAELRRELASWIDGLAELITLDRAVERAARLIDRAELLVGAQRRQRRLEALGQAAMTGLGYLVFWSVLVGALLLVERDILSGPLAVGLALLMLGLVEVWQATPGGWVLRSNCEQAARRIEGLGRIDDGLTEPTSAGPGSHRGCRRAPSVALDGLAFAWTDGSPLIEAAALQLDAGERIVVEGVSGGGKTTLGRLVSGELVPDCGRVLIDGRDLFDRPEHERHGLVGRLEQTPFLFRDTLAANLRIADSDATTERLEAVLDAVDLERWYRTLPEGLSTWLGERGVGLSGGQSRRLTLARLLLTDCPVLVLDEPLAGLDAATAERVLIGIEPWLVERTLLILSHDGFGTGTVDRSFRLVDGRLERN